MTMEYPATLSGDAPPPKVSSESLGFAEEQAMQLRAEVNAGIMTWLQCQGIDPDHPPEQWSD